MAAKLTTLFNRLKQGDWLSPLIDAYYEVKPVETWRVPKYAFSPSMSASSCGRSIQLSMLGHRFEESTIRRRFENGIDAHERWQRFFADLGILVEAEKDVSIEKPFYWHGIIDALIKNPETNEVFVCEIKTMNSQRWSRIPPQSIDYETTMQAMFDIEEKYAKQLTQYIFIMSSANITGKLGCFLFENTDTQEYKIRFVMPTEDHLKQAFELPIEAQHLLQDGILIDPPFERESRNCKMCQHNKICFAMQDNDFEIQLKISTQLAILNKAGDQQNE